MIRLAVANDYPAICQYLDSSWRKNHIFTKSKALFDWQHWDAARQRYNFILGCNDSGGIDGVLGFIPHGKFDPALGFDSIWLCIWHASVKGTGLGRRMLDWLEETFKPTFLATNGASEMSLPLYQARGWETGKLEHWYAQAPDRVDLCHPLLTSARTSAYVGNRYATHPFYDYKRHGSAVTRVCRGDVSVLRVVDLVPRVDPWRNDRKDIAGVVGTDFVDMYCIGIEHDALKAAGFTRRIADEVIIPSHFEPYEHRNIDINYAVKAPKEMPWRIVKGDGDQDRPNVLP